MKKNLFWISRNHIQWKKRASGKNRPPASAFRPGGKSIFRPFSGKKGGKLLSFVCHGKRAENIPYSALQFFLTPPPKKKEKKGPTFILNPHTHTQHFFVLGQFGTKDNLAPRPIWHQGQFGTAHVGGTIWHCSVKEENLAPGQLCTAVKDALVNTPE